MEQTINNMPGIETANLYINIINVVIVFSFHYKTLTPPFITFMCIMYFIKFLWLITNETYIEMPLI